MSQKNKVIICAPLGAETWVLKANMRNKDERLSGRANLNKEQHHFTTWHACSVISFFIAFEATWWTNC